MKGSRTGPTKKWHEMCMYKHLFYFLPDFLHKKALFALFLVQKKFLYLQTGGSLESRIH